PCGGSPVAAVGGAAKSRRLTLACRLTRKPHLPCHQPWRLPHLGAVVKRPCGCQASPARPRFTSTSAPGRPRHLPFTAPARSFHRTITQPLRLAWYNRRTPDTPARWWRLRVKWDRSCRRRRGVLLSRPAMPSCRIHLSRRRRQFLNPKADAGVSGTPSSRRRLVKCVHPSQGTPVGGGTFISPAARPPSAVLHLLNQ